MEYKVIGTKEGWEVYQSLFPGFVHKKGEEEYEEWNKEFCEDILKRAIYGAPTRTGKVVYYLPIPEYKGWDWVYWVDRSSPLETSITFSVIDASTNPFRGVISNVVSRSLWGRGCILPLLTLLILFIGCVR